LFSLNGGSTLAIANNGLLNVSGGSVFTLTGSSLGSFGTGTNTLSFTNAPLCGTSCVPLGSTGFNVLLSNGALLTNISFDPSFTGFSGLGGTNTIAGLTTGGPRALIVLDGPTSLLLLGQSQLQALIITSGVTNFSGGTNPTFSLGNISGGSLTGSDTVTINGLTTWTGGAMTGAGITFASGGMEIGGSGTKSLDTRSLSTFGTVNLTGGTLALTNGALLGSIGAFNNSASLNLISGDAVLQGGGMSTGNFTVASGTDLVFGGGTHDLNSGATLTGDGNIGVLNATVNLNASGIDRLTGSLSVFDGTLNVTGNLIDVAGQSFSPIDTPLNVLGNSTNANLAVTGNVFNATQGSTVTLPSDAPLLFSGNGNINVGGRFLNVNGGATVTSASGAPVFDFVTSTVNAQSSLAQISGTGSRVTLGGSLLEADGGALNFSTNSANVGDILRVDSGGQLVMTTAESPVLAFNGGSHVTGTPQTLGGASNSRVILDRGVTLDPATGLGTDRPIIGPISPLMPGNPVGTLLQVTGAGTLEVKGVSGVGTAIRVDAALLEASLPLIQVLGLGTTDATQSTFITGGPTIDNSASRVVSLGPVIALDNGLIRVTNGPLINLREGATMSVTGDLLRLTNGSRINVVNGPLILVTGSTPTGTNADRTSFLNVTGSLVNFGGSGGNQIIVNNNIAPTATLSGIAVSTAGGGGAISITNPIRNPALGGISVTGSLIQTTNGGRVTISGN